MKRLISILGLFLFFVAAARAGEGPRLMQQLSPGNGLEGTALSPSGRLLCTWGGDFAWLWEVESGRQLRRFTLEERDLKFAVFLSDEELVLVYWQGVKIVRTDTARSRPLLLDERPLDVYTTAAASRDGKLLVLAGRDETRLFRMPAGELVPIKLPRADEVALSANGRWLALVIDPPPQPNPPPGRAEVWDLRAGARVDGLGCPTPPRLVGAVDVALSADGKFFACLSAERIDLFDTATRRARAPIALHAARAIALSPDGHLLAIDHRAEEGMTILWDVARAERLRRLDADGPLHFSSDGARLVAGLQLRRIADAELLRHFAGASGEVAVTVSGGGRVLAISNANAEAWIWDFERARPVHVGERDPTARSPGRIGASPDGERVVLDNINGFNLLDARSGRTLRALDAGGYYRFLLSPDGKWLLQTSYMDPALVRPLDRDAPPLKLDGCHDAESAAFSRDGTRLACADEKSLSLWETATGKHLWKVATDFKSEAGHLDKLSFVSGEEELFSLGSRARLWSARTGALAADLGPVRDPENARVSPDGRYFAGDDESAAGHVFDLRTRKAIAETNVSWGADFVGGKFYSSNYAGQGRWVVDLATKQGGWRKAPFDGDALSSWLLAGGRFALTITRAGELSVWSTATEEQACRLFFFDDGAWAVVAPDGRFDTNRVESLDALHWVLPEDPLHAVPIETFLRDYFEPGLLQHVLAGDPLPKLTPPGKLDRAQPRIAIARAADEGGGQFLVEVEVRAGRPGGQAQDLRLFRDGRLVARWPDPDAPSPRIPLGSDGRARHVFHVKVPESRRGGDVEFSAYAFNADRVKSATARQVAHAPCLPSGSAPRKPRAFVIAAGVSDNESPAWKLTWAAQDALAVADALGRALERAGVYEVERVPLIASSTLAPPEKNLPPTKANLRATFQRVAAAAAPDDLIVVWFSGHGYGTRDGNFFLFPYDLGETATRELDGALLAHLVGADELAAWLAPIDARVVLFIDACQSAAVAGAGFKPGPFGARGLGQLAYDRGMQLVTATQADKVAVGSGALGHSLLAAALVTEALEKRRAARPDRFTLADAIDFAAAEVPRLYRANVKSSSPPQVPVTFDYRPLGADVELEPRPPKRGFTVQRCF